MSTKFIHSLSDENPDLQKQLGCMNGIFQLFDRQHFLGGGRRVTGQNHKRLPSDKNGNQGNGIQPHGASQNKNSEKNNHKVMKEKHRTSTESSRTSFSSSSCSSSISSLECSKASQLEPSSYSQIVVPENHARNSHTDQPNVSLRSSQQSVYLQDVVKDSIHREARSLSVKTATKGEGRGQTLKYFDSPRPQHYSNSVDPRVPCRRESFRGLHKLQEATYKSNEEKNDSLMRGMKDACRFSFDGRESRDTLKSTVKLKELPRLSLDSRAGSTSGSNSEMKSNYLLGHLERGNANPSNFLNDQQDPGSNKRPSSVVAKLMGLEDLPDPISTTVNQTMQIKTHLDTENKLLGSSRITDVKKQNQISGSPRNLHKEPSSPHQRNASSVKKPTTSSKLPIEPAPWRQLDGSRGSQAQALNNRVTNAPNSSLSVYGEIERRLAQLEFQKSGKDLRALKQILEAMQKTKEMLETKTEASDTQTSSNSLERCSKSNTLRHIQSNGPISSPAMGTSTPKSFKSPIVIMKPAKLIGKASNPLSAANSMDSSSSIHKLHSGLHEERRKESVDKQAARDVLPRTSHLRDPSTKPLHRYSTDKSISPKSVGLAQSSKDTPGRSSGTMNLRLQEKLGFEKKSHPTIASSDSNRSRRQPFRLPAESGSPHRKPRPKSPNLQPSDDELSDVRDLRDLNHQGDVVSQQSESNISLASQVDDDEVSSTNKCHTINRTSIQQAHWKEKNLVARPIKDTSNPERQLSSEQPSPVSVLDATFYGDELPSPVKKITIEFKDDEALDSDEVEWVPGDANCSSNSKTSSLNLIINQKNGQSIQSFIQNLKEILSTHDTDITKKTTPLHNHTNPDHQYISQICLASGLHKDFGSGFTSIDLKTPGILINPDIFHALEHAKASCMHFNDDHNGEKFSQSETHAKIHRKLLFDVVNEILADKLLLGNSSKHLLSTTVLVGERQRRHQLLGELFSEVDRLRSKNSCCLSDNEDSEVRSILWEDLTHQSIQWTACHDEIQGIVLDIERLIFKDLITEVITGEMIGRRGKLAGHCRQLFSK